MPRALRRVTAPFGQGLIVRLIRRLTTAERRGTSSVKFSHPFLQATPPSTRYVLRGYSSTPQRKVGLPPSALQTRSDLDAHTRPNREASRSIIAWPLHRRPCGTTLATYPSRRRVRAVTSVRGRTRTGRIWFNRTAPFETWYENPSTHANARFQLLGASGARHERSNCLDCQGGLVYFFSSAPPGVAKASDASAWR